MTDVPLREYVDSKFTAQEKAVNAALVAQKESVAAALASSDKAIDKSEKQAEAWRAQANEWRATMTDREVKFVNKDIFDTLNKRVSSLEGKGEHSAGITSGLSSGWKILIQVVTIMVGVVTVILALK